MRRKLFSDSKFVRRRLFNDNSLTSELDKGENPSSKIIVCLDCSSSYYRDGASTTNFICPNCGGNRFEVSENVLNEPIPPVKGSVIDSESSDVRTDESSEEVNKAFSNTRRKLFNTTNGAVGGDKGPDLGDISNAKLVNREGTSLTNISNKMSPEPGLYTCPDCGHQFNHPGDENIGIVCPRCGGDRCRLSELGQMDPDITSDTYTGDKLDDLLKDAEGKTFSESSLLKLMSKHGINGDIKLFSDTGYANVNNDGSYTFNENALADRRLFSKIVISVVKEFDIDPNMSREMAINSLSERMPERSIMLLKRAGGYETPESVNFSAKDFITDSGIANDLSTEYGGTSLPLKSFMSILSEEYPDAPDNIIDLLVEDKVIKINGSNVQINK